MADISYSIRSSRKRKCSYEENDSESTKDKKIIIVQQNKNKELLNTIINNQIQLNNQLIKMETNQKRQYENISNQIHKLQINITNYELLIPNIIKERLKDSINEIIYSINVEHNNPINNTNTKMNTEEEYKYYDNTSKPNYIL